jgi:hypothetical protein
MDELEWPPRVATILIGEHRIVNALVISRLRGHAREGLSEQVLGYCGKYSRKYEVGWELEAAVALRLQKKCPRLLRGHLED